MSIIIEKHGNAANQVSPMDEITKMEQNLSYPECAATYQHLSIDKIFGLTDERASSWRGARWSP